jgi:hypothetical protein
MYFTENDNKLNNKYYADYLLSKYDKLGLTRKETAYELGISISLLDKLLKEGIGLPDYKRLGTKRGRIIFPIDAVADFMRLNAA